MRIIVLVKPVPTEQSFELDSQSNNLKRGNANLRINPLDIHAIEESIKLKEKYGGEITLVSMAPLNSESVIRKALSYGIDHGILLSSASFSGSDTLATSYILSKALEKWGYDIILTGKQSYDGDTGHICPGVAEYLGIAHISDVREIIEIKDDTIIVRKYFQDDLLQLQVKSPVIVSCGKGLNTPRIPTIYDRIKSLSTNVIIWDDIDLELDKEKIGMIGSPTYVDSLYSVDVSKENRIYHMSDKEGIKEVLNLLQIKH